MSRKPFSGPGEIIVSTSEVHKHIKVYTVRVCYGANQQNEGPGLELHWTGVRHKTHRRQRAGQSRTPSDWDGQNDMHSHSKHAPNTAGPLDIQQEKKCAAPLAINAR